MCIFAKNMFVTCQMNGWSTNARQIFEDVSKLDCIKDYCLIGGTALAIQIGPRLSEDLDFCVWKKTDYTNQKLLKR